MGIYYTIQRKEAWERAKEEGYLFGQERYIIEDFVAPYQWMITQMNKRMDYDGTYPVWVWLEEPDLQQQAHLLKGEDGVCLTLNIPDEQVLISNFDGWHCVLNDWFCPFTETEDEAYDKGHANLTKEESWERIFDLEAFRTSEIWSEGEEDLQGVTGKISLEQVINVTSFVAK